MFLCGGQACDRKQPHVDQLRCPLGLHGRATPLSVLLLLVGELLLSADPGPPVVDQLDQTLDIMITHRRSSSPQSITLKLERRQWTFADSTWARSPEPLVARPSGVTRLIRIPDRWT